MIRPTLTTKEVLKKLGICRQTLLRWRDPVHGLGFPEPVQLGGPSSPNRYDEAEVEAWYEERARRNKLHRLPSKEGKPLDAVV